MKCFYSEKPKILQIFLSLHIRYWQDYLVRLILRVSGPRFIQEFIDKFVFLLVGPLVEFFANDAFEFVVFFGSPWAVLTKPVVPIFLSLHFRYWQDYLVRWIPRINSDWLSMLGA